MRSALSRWRGSKVARIVWDYRLPVSTAIAVMLLLALYGFFITAGNWATWPETSRYYDQLATAFENGHLYLGVQAPDSLRSLPDPYDPQARNSIPALKAFVDQVWDASFYDGKVYPYWGPVPALCLWIARRFGYPLIGDQYLAFAFLGGLLIFTSLLLIRLAQRIYRDVPASLIVVCVLVAALACPIPWMLSRPAIYEAAIAAGQFFLIGGLYFAYSALDRGTPSRPRLLMAGVLWALAAGSRLPTILPAAFLILATFVWLVGTNGAKNKIREAARNLLTLGLPVGLGILCLGWYNWARFGSVFETGLRYALTYTNLDKFHSESFSLSYVLPNLWFFLLNPISIRSTFPFMALTYGRSPSFLDVSGSHIYHLEEIAGLMFVAPFVLFSIVPVIKTISWASMKYAGKPSAEESSQDRLLLWLSACLIGSSILSFATLLVYFYVAMRLLADFVPSLVLLSALGVLEGYHYLHEGSRGPHLYASSAIILASLSIAASTVLTIASNYNRFQHLNPHLFRSILRFFTH